MGDGVSIMFYLVVIFVCFWVVVLWRSSRRMNIEIRQVAQQHSLVRHDEQARALARAIHLLNPHVSAGVDYIIRHDNTEQQPVIQDWLADDPRPTDEQIRRALEEIADSRHEERYAALRRAAYPSVGEQLEAAYEARNGNPAKQHEVDEKIRLVREKYPKSEAWLG